MELKATPSHLASIPQPSDCGDLGGNRHLPRAARSLGTQLTPVLCMEERGLGEEEVKVRNSGWVLNR